MAFDGRKLKVGEAIVRFGDKKMRSYIYIVVKKRPLVFRNFLNDKIIASLDGYIFRWGRDKDEVLSIEEVALMNLAK
jgi:hypothetical protein